MNEAEFNRLADRTLQQIAQAFDALDAECDSSFTGDGVLQVEFEQGAKLVINRHAAAQEIWVADRSGGFHFRHADGRWTGTRDGRDLMEVLAELVARHTGRTVSFGPVDTHEQ